MQKGVIDLAGASEQATGKINKLTNAANKIANIGFAVQHVIGVFRQLNSAISASVTAYSLQAQAETKLAAVMRNTMNAGQDEVDAILKLASAQQKLGVIGDEIQLAGAQEMAMYLKKSDNLKALIPVINDMVAQEKGMNATMGDAVTAASMLGKAMNGQIGILSRSGIKMSEVQENILKLGTEEQKVAVLAEVFSKKLGGVNEALAATPEGRLKGIEGNEGNEGIEGDEACQAALPTAPPSPQPPQAAPPSPQPPQAPPKEGM
jgi:hypothetical protein